MRSLVLYVYLKKTLTILNKRYPFGTNAGGWPGGSSNLDEDVLMVQN